MLKLFSKKKKIKKENLIKDKLPDNPHYLIDMAIDVTTSANLSVEEKEGKLAKIYNKLDVELKKLSRNDLEQLKFYYSDCCRNATEMANKDALGSEKSKQMAEVYENVVSKLKIAIGYITQNDFTK